MSKKLEIEIKNAEKLQFIIKNDGQAGDYIDLRDILNKDFTNIHSFKSELVEKLKQMYKEDFLTEYENRKKQEQAIHEKLLQEKFNSDLENQKLKAIQEVKNEFNQKLSEKEQQLTQLKADLEIEKRNINIFKDNFKLELENRKNQEFQKLEQEYNKSLIQKDQEFIKLKSELENERKNSQEQINLIVENKVGIAKNNLIEEYKEKLNTELKDKEIQISSLERQLNDYSKMSTKMIGEDLENKVEDRLREMFGTFKEFVKFGKITKAKSNKDSDETSLDGKKTKADFYVEFLSKETRESIGKVIIECKSQEAEKGTTKNSDHFKKLEKDRYKENAHFALLVTNLESKKEFFVYTPDEDDYQQILVLRFPFLGAVLSLLYSYFEKLERSKISEESVQNAKEFFIGIENIKKMFIESLKGLRCRQEEIFKTISNLRAQTDKLEDLIDKMIRIDLKKIHKSLTSQQQLPSEYLPSNSVKLIDEEDEIIELSYEKLID
ncbi:MULTISPECIES: DUF2130 domain-containing protein [unclassified Mycoplasma]|uniref:DUF2130 domain-containing protein n=1 Tax=unclassified Mycoplasma TaxID=2683645 RepID=UPI00211C09E5|nr:MULTISPECIES: DUF2130 domain-containing protein [unclassified Mycoplasma]UUM19853.1 DUF2130 domain-containing protein [Mycoplasma sp. 1578d]UUM24837.1 DUF2130 domain-containing protein [Mycoplasma sp. 3686d]